MSIMIANRFSHLFIFFQFSCNAKIVKCENWGFSTNKIRISRIARDTSYSIKLNKWKLFSSLVVGTVLFTFTLLTAHSDRPDLNAEKKPLRKIAKKLYNLMNPNCTQNSFVVFSFFLSSVTLFATIAMSRLTTVDSRLSTVDKWRSICIN